MLELLVKAGVEEHRVAPALHRVFAEELPRSARAPHAADGDLERNWQRMLEPFARNVPDYDLAAFVARAAVHAIIHEAASERPELLADPRLVSEIVLLIRRYLRRPKR